MSLSNTSVRNGYLLGTGAAVNISCGFIPKRVDVFDITDGTIMTIGFPQKIIAFTSGGTAVPVANVTKITGITSGAIAKIKDILLISGTYAAGTAAGWFICDPEDITGTFQSENATMSGSAALNDDVTVVAQVDHALSQTTTAGLVLATTATTGIATFNGDASNSKGFTIGSTVSVSGKLLRWTAFRD